jgi:hypothetical protein
VANEFYIDYPEVVHADNPQSGAKRSGIWLKLHNAITEEEYDPTTPYGRPTTRAIDSYVYLGDDTKSNIQLEEPLNIIPADQDGRYQNPSPYAVQPRNEDIGRIHLKALE